jgi:protoporphyrinogen oxidase
LGPKEVVWVNNPNGTRAGTLHLVGGGLTGMTVAWEAARRLRVQEAKDRRFHTIELYESLDRFGGKAGSQTAPKYDVDGNLLGQSVTQSDHGYHLFPTWYHNVIELMGQIGVDYDEIAVEGERFGKHPRGAKLATSATRTQRGTIRAKRVIGRLPGVAYDEPQPADSAMYVHRGEKRRSMAAFLVTAADLVATDDAALEQLTMYDYLRRRHPLLRRWARPVYDALILKALSADTKEMSALAVAKMFRRWMTPVRSLWSASWSSLDGSLQAKFIEPFVDALEDLHIDGLNLRIQTGRKLQAIRFDEREPKRARELVFESGEPVAVEMYDCVVLAVPADVLEAVTSGYRPLQEVATRLASMTSVFSGLDVYFPGYVEVPREHFGFDSDDIPTTAYDISSVWPEKDLELGNRTVLQLVTPAVDKQTEITDDASLVHHVAQRHLAAYFKGKLADTTWLVHRNHEAKLSLANTDVYSCRRDLARMQLPNLTVAGDFMGSSIDVPSMEAAVGNGRRVAARIVGGEPQTPDEDVHLPWWYLVTAWAFTPIRRAIQLVEHVVYWPAAAAGRLVVRPSGGDDRTRSEQRAD